MPFRCVFFGDESFGLLAVNQTGLNAQNRTQPRFQFAALVNYFAGRMSNFLNLVRQFFADLAGALVALAQIHALRHPARIINEIEKTRLKRVLLPQ